MVLEAIIDIININNLKVVGSNPTRGTNKS